MKNWFNQFNRGRSSLKNKIREVPPKTAVVSENMNAVCALIMHARHVTYREIDAPSRISPTHIHSILHEQLDVNTFVFFLIFVIFFFFYFMQ